MEPIDLKCDACGAPATQFARDVACTTNLAIDKINKWDSVGHTKCGCDNHPPQSVTHDRTFFGIQLKYARYEVYPSERKVRTVLPTGHDCEGLRDLTDWCNIREANSQGYVGEDCVWRSLVEHELLHSLVAEVLFDRPSRVILTESGVEFTPLWERYEEEMLCLAMQAEINDLDKPACLFRYPTARLASVFARMLVEYRPLIWCT